MGFRLRLLRFRLHVGYRSGKPHLHHRGSGDRRLGRFGGRWLRGFRRLGRCACHLSGGWSGDRHRFSDRLFGFRGFPARAAAGGDDDDEDQDGKQNPWQDPATFPRSVPSLQGGGFGRDLRLLFLLTGFTLRAPWLLAPGLDLWKLLIGRKLRLERICLFGFLCLGRRRFIGGNGRIVALRLQQTLQFVDVLLQFRVDRFGTRLFAEANRFVQLPRCDSVIDVAQPLDRVDLAGGNGKATGQCIAFIT